MRLSIIRAVFIKEARELLRDRRSLAVMFGLPLVLYPLLAIGIASLGKAKKDELTEASAKVVLINAAAAPELEKMMSAKDSGIELAPPALETDARKQLSDGSADAVVEIPAELQKRALAGEKVEIQVVLDRSRTSADFVEKKIKKGIDGFQKWVIEQRLAARGVPETVLTPVDFSVDDVANSAQRFGHLFGQALPVLLMMTGMLGALFPALNATTTERELGTLEALLLTPANRFELLTAKGLLVLLCGLLTAGLNMLSMSLVLVRTFSLISGGLQKFSVSPITLALAYLAAVPTLIFFSALVLIVGLVARNFREANSFATPVMLIPLSAFAVAMMEPKPTAALLITPVANTTIVIREVLTGRATVWQFMAAFVSSALYAGIILSLAGRLFSSEQLVNPAWEPLSLKLFKRRKGGSDIRRLPAVDEALVLFCVVLLLLFYVSPYFAKHDRLLDMVLGNELVLILAPVLVFAFIGRWDWVKTFSLRNTSFMLFIAAGLIGGGISPWTKLAQQGLEHFWPSDLATQALETELFVKSLQAHAILTVLLTGLLAGVCEEMLFRGPIQASMMRRLPAGAAIIFTAILFAAIHLDVHGLPIRTAIGALLGYIVWSTGSIWPAMLAHMLFDSTQLAIAGWQVHLESAGRASPSSSGITTIDVLALVLGAIAIAAGMFLWRRSQPTSPSPALTSLSTPAQATV
jgi:sodium transport system permease protein